MIPSGVPDGSFQVVPETLDLHGMPIITANEAFRHMYGQLCRFPTKLIPEAMDLISKAVLTRTLHPSDFSEDNFLAPIRWVQNLFGSETLLPV
jgi:hypothetical protein